MKALVPYINFNGRCQKALDFYKSCFGHVDMAIETFGSIRSSAEFGAQDKDKIMHAEFKTDGLFFMASDGQAGQPFTAGNNVHLSLQLDSVKEQAELFAKLSEGGMVTLELHDTFWNARFGMFTDKFGIHWMINVPLS